MRITAIVLAAAAALVPLAPVAAEPVEVRINYGDLDLRNPAHVKQLRKRSAVAIQRACRGAAEVSWNFATTRNCEVTAMQQAKREIERHRQRYAVAMAQPTG